jgi:hypothetical protein
VKKLSIILAIVFLPSVALANFSIEFENTSDKKMIYLFYWLDHPFKSFRPASMAGGELKALQSRRLINSYESGKYCVIWKDNLGEWKQKIFIEVQGNVSHITVTPQDWRYEKGSL